ncbi:hypothetical protein M9Y10_044631 [Tritrichomonas musculus]|uniref:EDRF1 TPR repeats region domain-containing protein n=2 Tax=Tritrichomonas musculus TaxID=1915356 RepID=A0ABR2JSZ3_9EUKA
MDSIPQYQIRQSVPHIDVSNLRSKIAIDKSPIAPFKKLKIGEELSVPYSLIKNPPPPLKPFFRSMKSRSEATLSSLPLVITQLAQSGPDADFTMSMEALTAISLAVCFDSPLALVFYNINDQLYFDEPLHHESHPWSQLFIQNNLLIDISNVENISMLSTIASCAFDKQKEPHWFSKLKGDVVASERSQQRWFRDTEKYLPLISEDFTRSFICGITDISLHIGSNSVICDIDENEPAIVRFCKGDPTEKQACKWVLEGLLTACKNILITSSESMKLTRFEITEIPKLTGQRLSLIFDFLRYIKKYSTEFGCYMIHKRANSSTITLRKASDSELENAKLTKSYQNRISLLEMMIGFRQTLSINNNIIENGRKLLFKSVNISSPLHRSLSLERIGDSLILPILLLDRNHSLISATNRKIVEQILSSSYDEAIKCYNQAIDSENLPESLITSIHHKLATSKFAKAVLTRNDELAKDSLKCDEITHDFKYNVSVWRCQNALELSEMVNSNRATKLNANLAKTKNHGNKGSVNNNNNNSNNNNLPLSPNSSSSSNVSSSPTSLINYGENDSEAFNQMAQSLAYSALRIAENDSEKVEPTRLLAKALNAEAQSNVVVQRYTRASERFLRAHSLFESIDDKEHLAETEANLAHIERCLANNFSITHNGKFTQEEERRLMSAAKYYLTAIDRVKENDENQKIRDGLCLDLASLYRSIVVRYTQMPPINRMKPEQIIEEVNRCINEATNILNEMLDRHTNNTNNNNNNNDYSSFGKTNEIQKQFAALNTWQGKFITDFELKHITDTDKRQVLASKAKNLFTKARQFLIADNYPADFVSITLSMASLKLSCGQPLDAMRIMMDCLKALRPTSLILRPKNQGFQSQSFAQQQQQQQQQSQSLSVSRSVLNNMLPSILEMIRAILKEITLDKFKRKQPCEFEKSLYKSALDTHENGVVDLMVDLKKALKL